MSGGVQKRWLSVKSRIIRSYFEKKPRSRKKSKKVKKRIKSLQYDKKNSFSRRRSHPSAVLKLGAGLLLRQAVKLVPGYGQTVGAASAATVSFVTTVALGRSAAAWLHSEACGQRMTDEALQTRFRESLKLAVRSHG